MQPAEPVPFRPKYILSDQVEEKTEQKLDSPFSPEKQ